MVELEHDLGGAGLGSTVWSRAGATHARPARRRPHRRVPRRHLPPPVPREKEPMQPSAWRAWLPPGSPGRRAGKTRRSARVAATGWKQAKRCSPAPTDSRTSGPASVAATSALGLGPGPAARSGSCSVQSSVPYRQRGANRHPTRCARGQVAPRGSSRGVLAGPGRGEGSTRRAPPNRGGGSYRRARSCRRPRRSCRRT